MRELCVSYLPLFRRIYSSGRKHLVASFDVHPDSSRSSPFNKYSPIGAKDAVVDIRSAAKRPSRDPETLATVATFSYMLEDIQSDDPFVRSRAVQSLDSLSPLIQDLAQSKKTVHYTAGKFKSLQDACAILEVTHKTHEHIWDRQDIDDVHSVTLSPDVDSVIQRLHHSEYHKIDNWESSVRVVVELIILDRLHNLSDRGALEHLQLYPEVDVDLLVGKKHITSRADWLLCHDDPRYSIDSTSVAIEANRSYEFFNADCQLATYLTAIQASRAKISKVHAIAFGIMTDANRFQFGLWTLNGGFSLLLYLNGVSRKLRLSHGSTKCSPRRLRLHGMSLLATGRRISDSVSC